MVKISNFGEEFLLLALRIDKHINGFVDFYIGPEKLKQTVKIEAPLSPTKLLKDSIDLTQRLKAQGYNKEREKYLEKIMEAMKTSIEILNGTEIPVNEEFLKLYDVKLYPADESELHDLKREFEESYDCKGSLKERFDQLEIQRRVPEGKIYEYFKRALQITKKRTKELFFNLLPEDEQIFIDTTQKKDKNEIKWSCYEWYLGNYKSRIEINPYFNMFWTALLIYAAHEGYPGHHTEFSVKERILYRELNQFEHSILLLNSPKLLMSEGIADLAINVLFSFQDQVEIGLKEFCLDLSKEDPVESLVAQFEVRDKIRLFW